MGMVHRQRCGGHQQVHHCLSNCGAERSDDEHRLPHNLADGPPAVLGLLLGQIGNIDGHDHHAAQHRQADQKHVRRHEGSVVDHGLAEFCQLWPHESGNEPARQHQRNRPALEIFRGHIRSRKPVELRKAREQAEQQRA